MPERVLPPAQHETQDMPFGAMAIAGALLLLGVMAIAGIAHWLFPRSGTDRVISQPAATFAEPRLQTSPSSDMSAFRAEQMRQLTTAYWLDKAGGIVHLPIADAMAKLAAEGDPTWPAPGTPAAGAPMQAALPQKAGTR